jgi:hypothetical protein
MYEIDNRIIYNSTVGGNLEIFKRKEFKSIFNTEKQ